MRDSKRAIINTSIMLLISVVLTSILPIFYFESRFKKSKEDSTERNGLAGSIDTVFLGASHAKCAIDPQLFDSTMNTDSYNLSYEMVSMKGRYEVLKYECGRNPIKTVYLELSHDALTREQHFEGDMNLASFFDSRIDRFKWLIKAFRFTEYEKLLSTATQRSINELFSIIHNIKDTKSELKYRGFKSLSPYWLEKEYSPTEYDLEAHNTAILRENELYLNKIISYCKERNIDIIIITVPISAQYINSNPSDYDFDKYYEYYKDIAQSQHILFFDFNLSVYSSEITSDKSNFYDACHLSGEGATKFTSLLTDIIIKSNDDENVSDLFYSSYEEMKNDSPYMEYINN